MNIGIFSDCYLPTKNGVTTVIVQTAQELRRRGHKVVILTVSDPGYVECDSAVRRFPSLPFNTKIAVRLGVARQAAVNRIVEREQLDLIHTHTEFSLGWAGKRAAAHAGLPLIHTAHTFYPAYRHYLPLGGLLPPRLVDRTYARFLRGYAALVCPSTKIRDYVATFAPSLRAVVIANGVDRERFDPGRLTHADRDRLRADFGIGPADRVILSIGRIAPEKRVLALFEALRPLLQEHSNYRMLFVGSGPSHETLLRAVQAAGLAQQVRLTGPVAWERMTGLYAIAHAFVTASLSEVHPMTLIEAAMCGVPVVARRDVSFADLVKDGYNGYLVDTDGDIAGKLAEILQDDDLQGRLARQARALSDQFTITAHVDRLEAFYQQLIAQPGRQSS